MTNTDEYEVIWDERNVDEDFFNMIDLQKGWVALRKSLISEKIDSGTLKEKGIIRPQIRNLIISHYGEEVFLEEE